MCVLDRSDGTKSSSRHAGLGTLIALTRNGRCRFFGI